MSNSSVDDLRLLSTDRIEQSAVPTAMVWFPPLTKESFILVANDQVSTAIIFVYSYRYHMCCNL